MRGFGRGRLYGQGSIPWVAIEVKVMSDLTKHTDSANQVTPEVEMQRAVELMVQWQGYKRAVSEVDEYIRAQLLAWCEANGRLEMGDGTWYYATNETETKCIDVPALVEELLTVRNGDIRAIADYIASDGIKPGAVRKDLPKEAFDRLFKVTPKTRLGKGGKALVLVNPKFIK